MVGLAIFAISSTYFYFAQKKVFNSAFLVSFITVISYTIMLEGSFSVVPWTDEGIYYTRWLFYSLSCTLLMYEIGRILGKSWQETVFLLYLTAIVMVTGALSSFYTGMYMLSFFVISSIAYLLLIYPLLTADAPHRWAVGKYIIFGWTGFPVAFILAPEGYGLIAGGTAMALYLLFDVFTKIIFYIDLSRRTSLDERAA